MLAFGHPSEIVSLQKICGELREKSAIETVRHYLHMLEEAYLVAALQKYSGKVLRQRASPPKLIPLSNAFMNVCSSTIPGPEHASAKWGKWVENACVALARNSGQTVYYWRQ